MGLCQKCEFSPNLGIIMTVERRILRVLCDAIIFMLGTVKIVQEQMKCPERTPESIIKTSPKKTKNSISGIMKLISVYYKLQIGSISKFPALILRTYLLIPVAKR